MDENDRAEIVKNLKSVDEVFLSIDDDKTVCKSLKKLKPSIFANGGDRKIMKYRSPKYVTCMVLKLLMDWVTRSEAHLI